MNRKYLRGYVERADEDAESGPLRIVAATEGMKGDGLNLKMDGVDLGRFQSNPVVGYGHSYYGRDNLPIGRATKTWVEDARLMMDIEFDMGDPFAAEVDRKYRAGVMSTFSIGFDVWDMNQETGDVNKWELFEVSSVPLPMDADAVVEAGRLAATRFASTDGYTAKDFADTVIAKFEELQAERGCGHDAEIERLNKTIENLRRAAGF